MKSSRSRPVEKTHRPTAPELPQQPHHKGHRSRLRERFMLDNGETMADYELLELLLFNANARRDMKPMAKKLLTAFGSFKGVVHAPTEALRDIEGLSDTTIASFKVVLAAAARLLKQEAEERPILASWQTLLDYCRLVMGHQINEQFRLLFLNHKNRLIADEVQAQGSVNHAPVYVREVVKRALELGAGAIILVHNHPSGDPTPSQSDVDITKQIISASLPLGIKVHDHVIITRDDHYSFKSHGLI